MAIATVTIDVVAQLAKFNEQIGQVNNSLKNMADTSASVGKIFAGNLLASFAENALAALHELPAKLIESVAAYQDLSEKTGTTAAGFASLQTAMDASGASGEQVAGAMVKLTTNLAKLDDQSKGAGKALAALGIPLDEFKSLRPDEQLERVAKALSGFEDGAAKSAVAVALFGKQGAELMPFLNDLADFGRNPFITDEQIAAVDAFSKQSDIAHGRMRQLAQVALAQSVPALSALRESAVDAAKELLGVSTDADGLAKNDGITTFAENAVMFLGHVVDAGDGVLRVFSVIGTAIGGVAAAAVAVATGDVEAARNIVSNMADDIDATLQKSLFSDRLKRKLDEIKAAGAATTAEVVKPKLAFSAIPEDEAKKAERAAEAYDKLIAKIREKLTTQQQELALGRPLNDAERFTLEMDRDLAENAKKLGPALTEKARAYLQVALAQARANAESLASAAASAKNADAFLREWEAANKLNTTLQDQIASLGLNTEAQRDITRAREMDTLQRQLERTEALQMLALYDNERQALGQLADALREQIDLRKQEAAKSNTIAVEPAIGATRAVDDYLDKVRRAGDATYEAVTRSIGGLEDALTEFVSTGKTDVRSLINTMLSEFVRLQVVRPLLASLFGGGSGGGGLGSAVLSMFGGWFADGGSPPVGKVSIVGERGPELFVPRTAGTIIPNHMLGSSGTANQVSVSVTVNQSGDTSAVEARSTGGQLGQAINAAVQQALARESRQGGMLWRMRQGAAA